MQSKTPAPPWRRKAAAFLLSQSISLFGSQIVQMAVIWYVTIETSSGLWVTVLTLAAFLPQMIVSLYGGVLADRCNRKRIIIIADAVIAITTLLLAVFMIIWGTGENALPMIIIVSAIRSLGSGIQTPAVNAMIPQLVPEEGLMRVNGINGSIQSAIQFISPVAAGAIMALSPIYTILFIDTATAAIGIGILSAIDIHDNKPEAGVESTSVFAEMKEGFKFTWNHKFLRRLLATYGAFISLCVPSGFLASLMIERTFGNNVLLLTINETVGFAGMFIGGLLLGVTGGFKNRNKTLFLGMVILGAASLAVGFTNVFWVFVVLMFIIGGAIPAAQTSVFTLVQEKTEPSMMGRVFSLVNVMFTGFMPLGMVIFGPLADAVRIQTMVIICAIFILLLGISLPLSRKYYSEGVMKLQEEAESETNSAAQ